MLSFVRGPWYLKRFFIIATEAYISATQKMMLTTASNILNKIDTLVYVIISKESFYLIFSIKLHFG